MAIGVGSKVIRGNNGQDRMWLQFCNRADIHPTSVLTVAGLHQSNQSVTIQGMTGMFKKNRFLEVLEF